MKEPERPFSIEAESRRIPKTGTPAGAYPLWREGGGMTLSEGISPSPHLQRRIREVQVFLEENLDRDVDLRTIAREASLSPYYFTRQFTAYVGVPPYRYRSGFGSTARRICSAVRS